MKNLLLVSFCLVGILLFGQTTAESALNDNSEISQQDLKGATFPGGNDAFTKLVYSKFNNGIIECDDESVQRTMIEFIVEKDGTLSNIKAIGANENLNKEGVRIVKTITDKWQPATLKGENVRMNFKQPIKLVCQ